MLRFLDVILVLATLPLALLLGAPVEGSIIGASVWALQRVIAEFGVSKAKASGDVKNALRINVGILLLRTWLVIAAILVAGLLFANEHGVAACLFVIGGFTLYLITTVLNKSLEGDLGR